MKKRILTLLCVLIGITFLFYTFNKEYNLSANSGIAYPPSIQPTSVNDKRGTQESATSAAYISDFRSSPPITIPFSDTKSKEEIAQDVFRAWLDKFTNGDVSLEQRLTDFTIQKVSINYSQPVCILDIADAEFIAVGDYSVRPAFDISRSDWIAGNGEISIDHSWINNKETIFAIFKVGDMFYLKLIGVGGC